MSAISSKFVTTRNGKPGVVADRYVFSRTHREDGSVLSRVVLNGYEMAIFRTPDGKTKGEETYRYHTDQPPVFKGYGYRPSNPKARLVIDACVRIVHTLDQERDSGENVREDVGGGVLVLGPSFGSMNHHHPDWPKGLPPGRHHLPVRVDGVGREAR